MRTRLALAALGAFILVAPNGTASASTPTLTDDQKTAVESVVRELLTQKEPEIILQAAQTLQKREASAQADKSVADVAKNATKLFNDPTSPVGGNLKGDVTMVEFFDYRCGYCKAVHPEILKALDADKNIRFVYKEFPIFGPDSVATSKLALASVRQDKYPLFHNALMAAKGHLTEEEVLKVAKAVGLDVAKLQKDAKDPAIAKAVEANQDLATTLGLHGTPAFIIGDKVYPGGLGASQIQAAVAEARRDAPAKRASENVPAQS